MSERGSSPADADPFNLQRFVDAQNSSSQYDAALRELRAGVKRGHWIWWIFPQLLGLGRSTTSRAYGIANLDEARAYLVHAVLGPRLLECTSAMTAHVGRSAIDILGALDAMKFRSSMTLFFRADPTRRFFGLALDQFFDGIADAETDRLLRLTP